MKRNLILAGLVFLSQAVLADSIELPASRVSLSVGLIDIWVDNHQMCMTPLASRIELEKTLKEAKAKNLMIKIDSKTCSFQTTKLAPSKDEEKLSGYEASRINLPPFGQFIRLDGKEVCTVPLEHRKHVLTIKALAQVSPKKLQIDEKSCTLSLVEESRPKKIADLEAKINRLEAQAADCAGPQINHNSGVKDLKEKVSPLLIKNGVSQQ